MNSLLAIDYGTKKSGLAYSVGSFCFSIGTVPTINLIPEIKKIINQKKIQTIIIGMPYNIDGTMSNHGKRVQKFVKILKNNIDVPIKYHDERLTSSEAKIFSYENDINIDIDAESARLILESFLDELNN